MSKAWFLRKIVEVTINCSSENVERGIRIMYYVGKMIELILR